MPDRRGPHLPRGDPGDARQGVERIVLFALEDAVQPYEDELPYCASKAGILSLAKALSKAHGGDGVLVNTVSPAFIATPMTDAMMRKRAAEKETGFDEAIASFLQEERPGMALRRRGEPREVAAAVAFLCSERASFINGAGIRDRLRLRLHDRRIGGAHREHRGWRAGARDRPTPSLFLRRHGPRRRDLHSYLGRTFRG